MVYVKQHLRTSRKGRTGEVRAHNRKITEKMNVNAKNKVKSPPFISVRKGSGSNSERFSEKLKIELDELRTQQDDIDTSDLQGIVMALAKEYYPLLDRNSSMFIQNEMLEYIYESGDNR